MTIAKNVAKIIVNTLLAVYIVIAAGIVVPYLLGIHSFAVTSGSMEPRIPTGSMVYVKKADYADIHKGDVITFMLDDQGSIVTHRVVEINDEKQSYVTKGDNNDNRDAGEVLYVNVIGKVRMYLPRAGFLMAFVGSQQGKMVALAVGGVLVLLTFFLDDFDEKDKEDKGQPEKLAVPESE